jgi:hypothetical protein
MDYFTFGRGVMAWWPFSSERFQSPVKLFHGLHWSDGVLSLQHVWTVATEAAFVALMVLMVTVLTKRKKFNKTP